MKLSHKELRPEGGPEFASSNSVISDESIYSYFDEMNKKYDLKNHIGVEAYIRALRNS